MTLTPRQRVKEFLLEYEGKPYRFPNEEAVQDFVTCMEEIKKAGETRKAIERAWRETFDDPF